MEWDVGRSCHWEGASSQVRRAERLPILPTALILASPGGYGEECLGYEGWDEGCGRGDFLVHNRVVVRLDWSVTLVWY